ncbi:MAG: serine hydrolase domain-containing protein [Bacillota bacterium]
MNKDVISKNCEEYLDEVMNLHDLPGLAIGVSVGDPAIAASDGDTDAASGGAVEFTGARGYRDFASRDPLREDTIFHCASVSKLFTSSAVMKLVEAGAFGPYDRLCDVLPDLRIRDDRVNDVRLIDMLTHTSGLGDVDDYRWYDFETDGDSLRRYVYESEEVTEQPMLWSPREKRFRYSNVAYEILGQIVSEYSDRMPGSGGRLSYEDFVARCLLEPAGMSSSTMKTFERPGSPDFRSNPQMALPHEKKPDRSIGPVEFYPYTRQHAPSSTLTSNVGDLLRWGRACMASAFGTSAGNASEGPLLKAETYKTVWREYAEVPNNGEKMGIGWFLRNEKPQAHGLCGHEGSDDGFRSSFWMCPALGIVTVVLSNLSNAPVKRINMKLFDLVAGI